MDPNQYDYPEADVAWCPGCGNFAILKILKAALAELEIAPESLVIGSGIGQAPKTPQYLRTHYFNGLHGRTLPVVTAIKAANPALTVLAIGGDGDMYGEGGNHFLHAVRRNPDITHLVHNNMVYGLTKGQASPTSPIGLKTPVQVEGVFEEPFNPMAVAVALNASFVGRAFCGNAEHAKGVLMEAIRHPGYALVDMFQPCVTFNKVNTFKWFKENTYLLDGTHDPADRAAAFAKACEREPYPLGVLYRNPDRPTFTSCLAAFRDDPSPLYTRTVDRAALREIVRDYA
jgi:2-oxoglutarate/2-oxoacid ferredoxin oxidoreductase subunit beta